MSGDTLTKEQQEFLEECEEEFSDRFTDSDMEYKLVREAGIPKPPIMLNWNPKLVSRYRGAAGTRYPNYRHHDRPYGRQYDRNRDRDRSRDRDRDRSRDNYYNNYSDNYQTEDRRYR